jgi:lipopolysaccharide assembly outer membrane protein LptD (OstA)
MPCYGFQLRLFSKNRTICLVSTKRTGCHGKTDVRLSVLALSLLTAPVNDSQATADRPDFAVKVARPNAPPLGEEDIIADTEETNNGVRHLRGKVRIELHNATLTADTVDYDENTSMFTAKGHVYYRNYEQNEVIYCDRAEYNTDTEHGLFYDLQGYAKTKVVARPGVLITQAPFYFQGAWAEIAPLPTKPSTT